MKEQKKQKARWRLMIMITALCAGLAAGMPAHHALGEDTTEDEAVAPTFTNPAQAQHAANIAEAVAAEPDEATLDALAAVEEAEAALEAALKAGDEQEIEEARIRLDEAEQAYADVIEARLGVITIEIEAMREADMGWGVIAKELGVHPSVLGLRHTKTVRNRYGQADEGLDGDEIAEATERNTRTGWAQGHGLGLDAGIRDTRVKGAYALGKLNKDKTAAGGIGGASGLSGSQGGAGGNGKGNGGADAGSDGGPGNSDKGKSQGGSGKSNGNDGGKGKGKR